MGAVDLIVIAWVAVSAALGARRGLVANVLGLAGFAVGALIGARIAPHLLSGGSRSTWLPMASMVGALLGGSAAQAVTGTVAAMLRGRLLHGPLRMVDTAGGLVAGALLGLAVAWLAAVVALAQPSLGLRGDVQASDVLPALLRAVPADEVLNAIAHFDPLPAIPSLADRALPPPDPSVLRSAAARRDRRSVVRIEGTACGLDIQGSGWVIRPGIVVTNAHVVAGEHDAEVEVPNGPTLTGTPIAVDAGNDVALLRVPGLPAPPLRMSARPPSGAAAVLIGYPENGPLTAVAGRAGGPITALAPNAYGQHIHARSVVPLRGVLRHGDSGGPVVNRSGQVVAMMFAADEGGGVAGGFGVPLGPIRHALGLIGGHVDAGPCLG
ncbi:MAG TPA: CvpA family protein [Gaiellales bacterium]|jgi:S1-C subfamily serine protease